MEPRPIPPASVSELAKKLLLARADEGDTVHPCGRAVFWIGAGTSISAGLPSGRALAGRLALRIAGKLGLAEEGADDEAAFTALQRAGEIGAGLTLATAYGELFARLDATQQRDFIRRVIVGTNRRQINWAHLALGELVRQRIVHTLLTTNFDDLLLDGLVRCDQLPAIIDGVESLNRIDPRPPVPQLVYLHGSQHTYSPRNSTEALLATRDLAQAQGGLFGLLQQCSVLVVVGYAGNPGEGVMELLQRTCRTLPELPIYWVAYGQQDSLSQPALELLGGSPYARLIPGQDADLFFRELLRETRIGVPVWFRRPVEHLLHLAGRISVGGGAESAALRDEVQDFRQRLDELRPQWERVGAASLERRELRQLLLRDDHAEVWRRLAGRELDDAALIRMRADAAYELGRSGLDDLLPQAVRDGWAVLRRLPEGSADWALAQGRLGDALAAMGERGDERAVRDAIAAYERALAVHTRSAAPLKWATSRHNQGLAWLTLGEWGDAQALEFALEAFGDTLEVYRYDAMPAQWARTQGNLGNALQLLGRRGDRRRLHEAVQAYDQALRVHTREQSPADWAMTLCDRAGALVALAQDDGEGPLRDAVRSLEQALEVVGRDKHPSEWATLQNNLGAALLALGLRGDEQALRRAIDALRQALELRARPAMAADWAATSNNLARALLSLGLRGDEHALREALEVLGTAMEVLRDDAFPAQHGLDIQALAQRVFDELTRVAARRPAPVPGQRPAAVMPARAGSRVLVVEDDEVEQVLVEAMLDQSLNAPLVHKVATGHAALQVLAGFSPDLVVLDLRLPDMPGVEVLAQLKARAPRVPVLVYSGDTQALSALQADVSGDIAILPKGAPETEFMRLVPTLFKRRQRDAAQAGTV